MDESDSRQYQNNLFIRHLISVGYIVNNIVVWAELCYKHSQGKHWILEKNLNIIEYNGNL